MEHSKEAIIYGSHAFDMLDNLPQDVVRLLYHRKLRVATAESCTGGMISMLITSVPGSSDVFDLGLCTYANEAKLNLLGINPTDLEQDGVVSDIIARQMAQGIRKLAKADIGVSTTGIAGPSGGTPTKPVGTVYVGVATETNTVVSALQLSGDRHAIRTQTAKAALELVIRMISDAEE